MPNIPIPSVQTRNAVRVRVVMTHHQGEEAQRLVDSLKVPQWLKDLHIANENDASTVKP
jgi:hypothetical protein